MSGRNMPGGYETWSKEDELRAQLAAATADRDAIALELSHLRPEYQRKRYGRRPQAAVCTPSREASITAHPAVQGIPAPWWPMRQEVQP